MMLRVGAPCVRRVAMSHLFEDIDGHSVEDHGGGLPRAMTIEMRNVALLAVTTLSAFRQRRVHSPGGGSRVARHVVDHPPPQRRHRLGHRKLPS